MQLQTITPCLMFATEAEPAAAYYCSIFPDSRIGSVSYYGKGGYEVHGRPAGTVLAIEFSLAGQSFTALNGGTQFKFNEAISLQVMCETQKEIDFFWGKLGCDEYPDAKQCGWLKDKFGVSWQVIPKSILAMFAEADHTKTDRLMTAMLKMKKLDIATLEGAFRGE
jgi:predicted 3-demethylubiquinone-9 3-methyltransferase (glyoxalase superfamily)